jgi:hypothetical protein
VTGSVGAGIRIPEQPAAVTRAVRRILHTHVPQKHHMGSDISEPWFSKDLIKIRITTTHTTISSQPVLS